MPLGISGELVIFGIVLGSLALAWYTSTWRTRLGWTYAWINLAHVIVATRLV